MARQLPTPRKQRTRQHIIADLSVNYVERLFLLAGHTAHRLAFDYGYDLIVVTYDENGYPEPAWIRIQIKASESPELLGSDYVYAIDIRDYNLWQNEDAPVFLIFYDAVHQRAYWLYVQQYFQADPGRKPRKDAKSIRVRIPRNQPLTRRAISRLRAYKQSILDQFTGVIRHV